MLKTAPYIITLITALPIGYLLAKLTKDEKSIYKKYFPPLLWIIAITAAVFYTINLTVAITLSFIFLIILNWWKAKV